MPLLLGSVTAKLGLDSSEYSRGILSANALTSVFGQTFANFVASPLAGSIDIFSRVARGAVNLGNEILSTAEDIQRLSTATGVTAETIQALREEFASAGLAAADADQSLRILTRTLGDAQSVGGGAADSFARLGIDAANLGTGESGLRAVLDALAALPDAQARASAANDLFGRGFGDGVAVLTRGAAGIDAATEKWRNFGRVLSSDEIAAIGAVEDRVEGLSLAAEGLARNAVGSFLAGLGGELTTTNEQLGEIIRTLNTELSAAARNAGAGFGDLVGDLRDIVKALSSIASVINGIAAVPNDLRAFGDRNGLSVADGAIPTALGRAYNWIEPNSNTSIATPAIRRAAR